MSNLIYKKMTEVMREIGPISKDQKNVAQGFKFRGIDQFVNALHPALVKNGIFLVPRVNKYEHELKEVTRSNGKSGIDKHVNLLMEYDFYAEDGSKVTIGPIPSEGLDSGDKATNKALSAALKYALIQTFSIPTEDMEEADKETYTHSLPRIAPQQPEIRDGVRHPQQYTVPGGTYHKRYLHEIHPQELREYITNREKALEKAPDKKPTWWDEFIEHAERYIGDLENKKDEEMFETFGGSVK